MNKLENLPEITDRVLDGLRADESLKTRIQDAALREERISDDRKSYRIIPVLLSAVAVMLLFVFFLNGKKPVDLEKQRLIYSFSAGDSNASESFESFAKTDPLSMVSMEMTSYGKTDDRNLISSLFEILKNHSEYVPNADIGMSGQLKIYDADGIRFSLPVKEPYIGWSDGIRKCESFFEAFSDHAD